MMKDSFPSGGYISVDIVSGEWRLVALLLMDDSGGMVVIYVCRSFSNVR